MGTEVGLIRRAHARPGEILVGDSAAFAAARRTAAHVARRHSTVLLLGETGTGKEVMARTIHARSPRADKPFIPVDCSSLSDGLFESELFGHVRGAFTGASRDSLGFIRAADGGTLFLDEIGELSATTQAKLLRVLQERRVVPVGETRGRPVDIRVIAATHRDLPQMVREGTFRQDLFFRLNVVTLRLPPLRERADDVLPLARHFLQLQAELYDEPVRQLAPDAAAALRAYDWPGNVREVANVMEQGHVLAVSPFIELADLPPHFNLQTALRPVVSDLRLEDVERRAIIEALRRTKFCKAAAARLLGMNIQRLNRRIVRLCIPRG
jgi:transcriptional regulator with PAS, ATPase and Fis domain